jgi:hypothetical protein
MIVAAPPEGVAMNCTWATVAALPAAAVADTETFDPTVTTDPTAGAVSATVGCELATVTDTADEVAVWAVESVSSAVNEYVPAVAGVHATV